MERELNKKGALGNSTGLKGQNRDKKLENGIEVVITMIPKPNKESFLWNELKKIPGIKNIVPLTAGPNMMVETEKKDRKFITNLASDVSRLEGLKGINILSCVGSNVAGAELIAEIKANGGMGCAVMRL
jgi:hypothetical protein